MSKLPIISKIGSNSSAVIQMIQEVAPSKFLERPNAKTSLTKVLFPEC